MAPHRLPELASRLFSSVVADAAASAAAHPGVTAALAASQTTLVTMWNAFVTALAGAALARAAVLVDIQVAAPPDVPTNAVTCTVPIVRCAN
jgi:hypothetical protein